jgi:hypothetical protein
MHLQLRRTALAVTVGAAVAAVGVTTMTSADATTAGCRVSYAISSQWPGGFGANVIRTNLGDPLAAWTLTWSFGAGQQVTQAWNTTLTQSGAQATAKNVSYNGTVATNGTASFGFNGSWTGSNPVPASFALNGYGIMVLTVARGHVTSITGFPDPSLFPIFGLPERD